jgi:glycosyltransferase involved in cell wall biosynthesis
VVERLKIALVSPVLPPGGASGVGVATFHHALGLARLGHDVHVFTWLDRGQEAVSGFAGVTVHRLSNPRGANWLEWQLDLALRRTHRLLRGRPTPGYAGALRDVRGWAAMALLKRSGRLRGFDIVEACEWGGGCSVLPGLRGVGTKVVRLHGSLYSHQVSHAAYEACDPVDVRVASWVERRGVAAADVVISPSQAMADDAVSQLGVQQPIRLLPNCIDPSYVDSLGGATARETVALTGADNGETSGGADPPQRPLEVIFSGRVRAMKGAHIISGVVGALRARADAGLWRFTLAGPADDASTWFPLRERRLGTVEVVVSGPLPTPQLIRLLWGSDIFLFPSQAENCPMAVLEAMACGLPVVASGVGGIPAMLKEREEGLLCPKDSVDAFLAALLELRDKRRRSALGAAARRRVEREFAAPLVARRWLELCHSS